MRGPIDYIIVGFEGNNFTGEILKELVKASDNKIIAVLALALITKDKFGNVAVFEATDPGTIDILKGFNLEEGLISKEDIAEVGELLENNTSAGLLIVEQLWAKGLKKAIINTNGTLLAEGRIHPEASNELNLKEGK